MSKKRFFGITSWKKGMQQVHYIFQYDSRSENWLIPILRITASTRFMSSRVTLIHFHLGPSVSLPSALSLSIFASAYSLVPRTMRSRMSPMMKSWKKSIGAASKRHRECGSCSFLKGRQCERMVCAVVLDLLPFNFIILAVTTSPPTLTATTPTVPVPLTTTHPRLLPRHDYHAHDRHHAHDCHHAHDFYHTDNCHAHDDRLRLPLPSGLLRP